LENINKTCPNGKFNSKIATENGVKHLFPLYPRKQDGEEGVLFVGGGGDLIFHCVTQGHKLIDLSHDSMLFGYRSGDEIVEYLGVQYPTSKPDH